MIPFLKKIFPVILFLFLNNCGNPATALLGPALTGAKTGSVYQASISYSSGKAFNYLKDTQKKYINEKVGTEDKIIKIKQPENLVALTTHAIEISEIIPPEPLP
tara:strand:- start:3060 stop:3371 length:312 start_codon:yes stop_codon:yes gene_type:complete